MAITVSFQTTQVVGAPSGIVLEDLSSGSDVNAVSRRITITTATNQWINSTTPSSTIVYTEWPLASGNTITLNYLTEDMALNITLAYVDIAGVSVASLTALRGFKLFNISFLYTLTQAQALQNQPPPMIIQDSNYYMNKTIFLVEIDSGDNAIELGDDIVSAQNCYSRATYMRLNEGDFF